MLGNGDDTPDILDGTRTPLPLWEALSKKYSFIIDLFASKENSKCKDFFSKDASAYAGNWPRHAAGWCFANPPYSRGCLPRFVGAALEQAKKGSAICALIPATPGTEWFNDHILRRCDTIEGFSVDEGALSGYCLSMSGIGYRQSVTFLRGRVAFDAPVGWPVERPWGGPATDSIVWTLQPPRR